MIWFLMLGGAIIGRVWAISKGNIPYPNHGSQKKFQIQLRSLTRSGYWSIMAPVRKMMGIKIWLDDAREAPEGCEQLP